MQGQTNGRSDSEKGQRSVSLLGLGKMGVSVLDRAILAGMNPQQMTAVDTDRFVLEGSLAQRRILLGKERTRGLGSFGDRELTRKLIENSTEPLQALLPEGGDLLMVASLGGTTGSELARFFSAQAKDRGIRMTLVALTPFSFEPQARKEEAWRLAQELGGSVDCLCVLSQLAMESWDVFSDNFPSAMDRWDRMVAEVVFSFCHVLEERDFPSLTPWELCRFFARCGFGEEGNGVGGFAEAGIGPAMTERLVNEVMDRLPATEKFPWSSAPEYFACLTVAEDPPISFVRELERKLSNRVGPSARLRLSITLEPQRKDRAKLLVLFPLPTSSSLKAFGLASPSVPEATPEEPVPTLTPAAEMAVTLGQSSQQELPIVPAGGRFERIAATVYKGQNLDVPTFRRRNLTVRM
ncbi:FtsZ/tubulin family protein [Candidatus Methylacidithermus pantelleriae]|uniref:Tubulin/FtsZ GTPase domain-containing protein n=1 Tax=Candidatus Methylacidithermus pantelleriae TaxID=2744239 RepID=A0A8J2BK45_9BACT|nr:hypothetical protein [Candidatus Methylacidithermus pantelleriae]CAF0695000.1 hypothetical protein MPNT_180023 [Candidatus Methylacidithermus pantelleriae]